MPYTDEELNYIYDKTGGYCYYCGKKLAFTNYGKPKRRGAWEVDHSNPISRGGTDYYRNLFPSCIPCNRSKRDRTRQQFRKKFKKRKKSFLEGLFILGALLIGLGALVAYKKGRR